MPMNALDVIRFDLQEAAEGLNRLIGSPEVLHHLLLQPLPSLLYL